MALGRLRCSYLAGPPAAKPATTTMKRKPSGKQWLANATRHKKREAAAIRFRAAARTYLRAGGLLSTLRRLAAQEAQAINIETAEEPTFQAAATPAYRIPPTPHRRMMLLLYRRGAMSATNAEKLRVLERHCTALALGGKERPALESFWKMQARQFLRAYDAPVSSFFELTTFSATATT